MKQDRLGLQLRLPNVLFLTIVGIGTVLGTTLVGLDQPQIWAGIGTIAFLVNVLAYRSRTLLGWIARALIYRRSPRENAMLYSAENTGITWDGERASTYIEILPQPYETTVMRSDTEGPTRVIPVDYIREELTQFDIHCEAVTIITIGHKYDKPTQLATTYHAAIGPIPALLYGRTIVEVTVALNGSIDSIYARRGNDGVAAGLSRTVSIAAERIRRRVTRTGWKAKLLTENEVAELHAQISATLTPALSDEHWTSCGPSTMRAIVYTPARNAWTDENYREWCRINTFRHMQILRLDQRRHAGDHAEFYLGYLTADSSALNTAGALGLRREYGQQGDILTAALPVVRTVRPSAIRGKALGEGNFPLPLYAGGIGTFIGHTAARGQVFVNFTVGDEPFYLIGPGALCQQLLLRLATSGRRIDIAIPGDEWRVFAKRIGATYQQNPQADIIATTEDNLTEPEHPNQVRLIWTTSPPRTPPVYAIMAGADGCVLRIPTGEIRYEWAVSTGEKAYFTVGTPRAPRPSPRPDEPALAGSRRRR